ncbi:TAXI family TRAP transporter solute-binding subunit [Arthrobacter sp.]|uniref:TAXI family TRAP transporter solute-binding subunit n=1 Tax=Arthrobacter sp. TaxID=1667 RepID=UPI0028113606|nr:TAXI family TRAP transporter solute-binding subunit [Arthrobacter sp.]
MRNLAGSHLRQADLQLSRRTVLQTGVALGLAGLILPALGGCGPEEIPENLTVAGGEPGGFYLEFSTLLAESLQRHGVAHNAVPMTTGGSLENIARLIAGEAHFAVALADAAVEQASAEAGPNTDHGSPGRIVALGKVYENYVHCVVRRDSGIRTLMDLAGKTAAIGAKGSGTAFTAHRIIQAAGLGGPSGGSSSSNPPSPEPMKEPAPVKELTLGLNAGLAALREGSIDAMLWSGGVPTAAITAANGDLGLRFLDLSDLIPAMRAEFGAFYDRVLIPEGSYEGTPAVGTVGVANLLLCRRDLGDQTVTKTVELLVGHARELIPQSSLGVQFLSTETLINTAGVPLHPAAAASYRRLHG